MRVVHETSMRHSPKSETEVLMTLEGIVASPRPTQCASSSCAPAPKGAGMTRRTREAGFDPLPGMGHLPSATVSRSTRLDSDLDREAST